MQESEFLEFTFLLFLCLATTRENSQRKMNSSQPKNNNVVKGKCFPFVKKRKTLFFFLHTLSCSTRIQLGQWIIIHCYCSSELKCKGEITCGLLLLKMKPVLSGGSSFYCHCSSSIFCGSWPVSPALLPLFYWFRCCGEDDDWQALCLCFSSTLMVLFRLLLCYSGFFLWFSAPFNSSPLCSSPVVLPLLASSASVSFWSSVTRS